jgi:hypothetical protein
MEVLIDTQRIGTSSHTGGGGGFFLDRLQIRPREDRKLGGKRMQTH